MSAANRWWRDYEVECLVWLRTLSEDHARAILVGQYGEECSHGMGHALCDEPVDFVAIYRRIRSLSVMHELFHRPTCPHCGELVMPWDPARKTPQLSESGLSHGVWHRECLLRGVIGSVGHQEGKCSCYGGTEEDPPGMTKREAATAACIRAGLIRPLN